MSAAAAHLAKRLSHVAEDVSDFLRLIGCFLALGGCTTCFQLASKVGHLLIRAGCLQHVLAQSVSEQEPLKVQHVANVPVRRSTACTFSCLRAPVCASSKATVPRTKAVQTHAESNGRTQGTKTKAKAMN